MFIMDLLLLAFNPVLFPDPGVNTLASYEKLKEDGEA
jgi:hypothetical protein